MFSKLRQVCTVVGDLDQTLGLYDRQAPSLDDVWLRVRPDRVI